MQAQAERSSIFDFSGATVVVAGAGPGIGLVIAQAFTPPTPAWQSAT
jgi:hypothetical protein